MFHVDERRRSTLTRLGNRAKSNDDKLRTDRGIAPSDFTPTTFPTSGVGNCARQTQSNAGGREGAEASS